MVDVDSRKLFTEVLYFRQTNKICGKNLKYVQKYALKSKKMPKYAKIRLKYFDHKRYHMYCVLTKDTTK